MKSRRIFQISFIMSFLTINSMHAMSSCRLFLATYLVSAGSGYVGYSEYRYHQAKNELKDELQQDPQIKYADMFDEPYYAEETKALFRTEQQKLVIRNLTEEVTRLKDKAWISRILEQD